MMQHLNPAAAATHVLCSSSEKSSARWFRRPPATMRLHADPAAAGTHGLCFSLEKNTGQWFRRPPATMRLHADPAAAGTHGFFLEVAMGRPTSGAGNPPRAAALAERLEWFRRPPAGQQSPTSFPKAARVGP